jgi:hypothetical protein
MGTSQATATEVQRLTGLATAADRTPESCINSARALLRFTKFADRSCRVAKRLAKTFMENQEVSAAVRLKATNLFTYAVERKVDEVEEAKEAAVFASSEDQENPSNRKPLPEGPKFFYDYFNEDYITEELHNRLIAEAIAAHDPKEPAYRYTATGDIVWTDYFREQRAKFHRSAIAARPEVYHLYNAYLRNPTHENREAFLESKRKLEVANARN